ncbi:nucleotidyltransferase domain-containing protein [Deltaproteobacteria bacterium]|nr:nucleotidyltransferase domain-containing protein [Deltaproteobacteria bacterium]
MDKNQYDICMEVLRRLDKAGVLSKLILIGSWCLLLYKEHYSKNDMIPALRTRDIDFLISRKTKFNKKINLPKLFEDLGFIEDYYYPEGLVKLIHPELIMEFLVSEKGRGSSKPYPLPFLSMNAQRLRLLDLLEQNTIVVIFNGLKINLPHPVNFGLHKLIISQRRKNEDKRLKDLDAGLSVLNLYIENEGGDKLHEVFQKISQKQKRKILDILEEQKSYNILEILNRSS